MYLTRTAGIETNGICHQIRILFTMYLTRTAGIETAQDGYKDTVTENVSYPHCGNWNNFGRLHYYVCFNVSYPHCGNWNCIIIAVDTNIISECILPALRELKLRFQFPAFCVTNNVSYPHCGNWNITAAVAIFFIILRNVSYPHCGNFRFLFTNKKHVIRWYASARMACFLFFLFYFVGIWKKASLLWGRLGLRASLADVLHGLG